MRDPRTGDRAAGVPPASLAFRLVVEIGFPELQNIVSNILNIFRMG
jgi:hypothetical protein